jgi:uncharacterized membrane protein
MHSNLHMTSGGWILSILAAAFILALAGTAVVWTSRQLRDRRAGKLARAPSARETLDRRLASGEINTEQYVELRRTLASLPESAETRR